MVWCPQSTLVFVSTVLMASGTPSTPPNIIVLLVDDLGYHDVGWKNPLIATPTIDALHADGVELTHHYVFKYCSPTRASFLTGRLPYHAHQWNLDENAPWGTNLNMTMISEKLKMGG
jgi:arylsulfatase B